MKSSTLYRFVGFCVVVCTGLAVSAQEPTSEPVAEHALLKENEGTWDAVVNAGGATSKGVMVNKMELGGLWLTSRFEGQFAPGQKFQGQGMDGYDPGTKKFVSVWVDSMSYAPMSLTGEYDKAKRTFTMRGEAPGPDGKPAKVKLVTVHTDKDHQSFKMFMIQAGNETEMMSIDYTRRK